MKAAFIHSTDPKEITKYLLKTGLSHTGRYWSHSVFHGQNLCLYVCIFGKLFFIFRNAFLIFSLTPVMLFLFLNANTTQFLTTPKMEVTHLSKAKIIDVAFMTPSLLKY